MSSMHHEPQTHDHDTPERTHEREVIVTDRSSGPGTAMLVLSAIVVAVVLVIGLLTLGGDGGGVDQVVPDEIDVNIDPGTSGGSSGSGG